VSTLGDTSKKRRRWVGTCGEDVIPLFGAENWSKQKRERERPGVDLGGRLFAVQCNNQKIAGVSGGGSNGGEIRPGQNVWDDAMSSFRPSNWSTNKREKKIRRGLKRSPNDANTHNIQPKTTRRDGGGIREDARPMGTAGGVQCDRFGCDRAQLM